MVVMLAQMEDWNGVVATDRKDFLWRSNVCFGAYVFDQHIVESVSVIAKDDKDDK